MRESFSKAFKFLENLLSTDLDDLSIMLLLRENFPNIADKVLEEARELGIF